MDPRIRNLDSLFTIRSRGSGSRICYWRYGSEEPEHGFVINDRDPRIRNSDSLCTIRSRGSGKRIRCLWYGSEDPENWFYQNRIPDDLKNFYAEIWTPWAKFEFFWLKQNKAAEAEELGLETLFLLQIWRIVTRSGIINIAHRIYLNRSRDSVQNKSGQFLLFCEKFFL